MSTATDQAGQDVLSQVDGKDAAQLQAEEKVRLAEAERNRLGHQLRTERKHYRQALAELDSGEVSKEEVEEINRIAISKGFDPKDETNRKQLELISETTAARERIRRQKRMGILTEASRSSLAKTLEELGYEQGSEGFNDMGQHLFATVGVESPDRFSDKEFVEARISRRLEAMNRKTKAGDPAEEEVLRRAGGQRPSSEPRVRGEPPGAAEKEFAERKGLSSGAAKAVKELEKNKPSWA